MIHMHTTVQVETATQRLSAQIETVVASTIAKLPPATGRSDPHYTPPDRKTRFRASSASALKGNGTRDWKGMWKPAMKEVRAASACQRTSAHMPIHMFIHRSKQPTHAYAHVYTYADTTHKVGVDPCMSTHMSTCMPAHMSTHRSGQPT